MARHWLDVSFSIRPGMAVWPGDPEVRLEPNSRIAAGDSCNTSLITMGTHTGTHMDAPWHFEEGAPKLHELDHALFFGDAQLLDLSRADRILPSHFDRVTAPRVLLKTRNSEIPDDAPFDQNYLAVQPDAAQAIVEKGIRLIGIDYLSIAPFIGGDDTHHRLLQAGVLIIEGLRLKGLAEGTYPFVALPMPLAQSDGAPCRAFVEVED